MKIFLYLILIAVEYGIAKIIWLLLVSMVFNGVAPVAGIFLSLLFLYVMIAVWRYGTQQISS